MLVLRLRGGGHERDGRDGDALVDDGDAELALNVLAGFNEPFGIARDLVVDLLTRRLGVAVGGSWVCPKADIAAGKFEKITELCKQARSAALGFEVAHVGVNCEDADAASAVCEKLNEAFDLPVKDGSSSMFASSGIEVMKTMFKGKNGHIAIRTNSVELAVAELAKKGFAYDESSAKYKNGRMTVAYLKDEFGGFAVHLLQK